MLPEFSLSGVNPQGSANDTLFKHLIKIKKTLIEIIDKRLKHI